MIDLLITQLENLKTAGALGAIGSWASIIGIPVLVYSVFRYMRRRGYARLEEENAELKLLKEKHQRRITELKSERVDFEQQIDSLQKRDSEHIILLAEKEREDGNEKHAIRHFKRVVTGQSTYMGQASLELANHHLGLFELDDKHATNAYRYALLAYLLSPDDQSAKDLIAELKSFKAFEHAFQGNFEEAARHFDDAYDFGVGVRGHDAAPLVQKLLDAYRREDQKGRFQTAFALIRQAHHLASSELPSVRLEPSGSGGVPIQLAVEHAYASSFWQLGQYAGALEIFESVHAKKVKVLGGDHPDTLLSAQSAAVCLNSLGRYDEALARHEEVHAKQVKVLGGDHPDTLLSAHNIASCLNSLGRYDEALARHEEVHAKQVKVLGDDHPDTLISAHNIASCLNSLDCYDEALTRLEDVHAKKVKVLGGDHPDTLLSAQSAAVCLNSLGRYDEALARHEEVHAKQVKVLGGDHPDTLLSAHNIASCLNSLGRYDEALARHEEVHAKQVKVLGDDHRYTLISAYNIASCLNSLGRYDEALVRFEEVHAKEVQALGDDHPDTRKTRQAIDEIKSRQMAG